MYLPFYCEAQIETATDNCLGVIVLLLKMIASSEHASLI